jgi:thymidylate synthase/dihydrofolate reductase
MEFVVAISKNGVIGSGPHSLPWSIPEDLQHFKELTEGHIVVMGRNTYESLKSPLKNRINIVVTSQPAAGDLPENVVYTSMDSMIDNLNTVREKYPDKKTYVIGGAKLYAGCADYCSRIHATYIDKVIDVAEPVYFPMPVDFTIENCGEKRWSENEKCAFQYITYERKFWSMLKPADEVYRDLLLNIVRNGSARPDRTGTGTLSIFAQQMRFDLEGGVPLLTTKYVPWKSVIKELLWFLRGQTDAGLLKAQGVGIWDGNTSREFLDKRGLAHLPEGDIGAGYGFQWRHFGAAYGTCKDNYDGSGYDQIAAVLDQLRNDPYSRRIYMSAWNPAALEGMALPPCHVSAQFYVGLEEDGTRTLSCHMYQRSVDVFLGLPFNIFSYAALTHLFAAMCAMKPKELIISTGDTHIYSDHIQQIQTQLHRDPMMRPILVVNPAVKNKSIEDVALEDFEVVGYFHHGVLKGKMAV